MAKYKITSSKVSVGEIGQTVDSDALVGCNIEALIEAGHIEPVSVSKFSKKSETEEQE